MQGVNPDREAATSADEDVSLRVTVGIGQEDTR